MERSADSEYRRLKKRLSELDAEREKVAFALDVLERISHPTDTKPSAAKTKVEQPEADVSPVTVQTDFDPAIAYRSTLEVAIAALEAIGTPADVEAVMEQMAALGWKSTSSNELESVRIALLRAAQRDLIQQVDNEHFVRVS